MNELNKGQKEVVEYNEGPQLVLAGAGSGKTKTLISKVVYLVEKKGLYPEEILAMTFSNKASKEMRERIFESYKKRGRFNISTFHSFCVRLLKEEFKNLDYPLNRNFSIFDDGDTKSVAKEIIKSSGYDIKELPPAALLSYIAKMKNEGFYVGKKEIPEFKGHELFYPLFLKYEKELERSNATDFSGLITWVLKIFNEKNIILSKYQILYKYLLVDEYQDTNTAQFDLVYLLAKKHNKICVVGDEDQCIYSWRGAKIQNILHFDKKFNKGKVFRLEQNYRSTKTIVDAASSMIENNNNRLGKTLFTENPVGDKISVIQAPSDIEESIFVTNKVKSLLSNGVNPKEIAVFYRKNAQSRSIEDKLRQSNVFYKIVGGMKFYDRKEIKDMVAYLKVSLNPKDSISVERVLNVPTRGIGKKTLDGLKTYAIKKDISLWESLVKLPDSIKVTKKAKEGIESFVKIVKEVQDMNDKGRDVSYIYECLLDNTEYIDMLEKKDTHQDNAKIENLKEFKSVFIDFVSNELDPSLENFLETITLDKNEDFEESKDMEITLMTVHASKGLEFDYVFVVGAEETVFPAKKSLDEGSNGLEEERRLFYVAMTRARKKLHILYSNTRFLFGNYESNLPSRFIREIPLEYIKKDKIN